MEPYEHMAQALALMEHAAFPAGAPGNVVYQQAPETPQPDWKQQCDAQTTIIQNLEAELARAKADAEADNTAGMETIDRLRRETTLWRDRCAWLETATRDLKTALVRAEHEADGLADLVSELIPVVRDGWWDDDAQANRVKAELAAHEKRYGRPGE